MRNNLETLSALQRSDVMALHALFLREIELDISEVLAYFLKPLKRETN